MKLTGAQIIIETLVEQGCDRVFGYPGGQIINVYDELYKNRDRIRHIITAHEQGAAMLLTVLQELQVRPALLLQHRVREQQIL